MKKLLCKIIAVVVLSGCLACLAIACQSAPVTVTADNQWQYTIYDETDDDGKVLKDDLGNTIKAVQLDAYLGADAEVVVPNSIEVDGVLYPVKKLGDAAFMKIDDGKGKWRDRETYAKNTTLTKVTISEGIVSVGHMCFYLCSELTEVVLPESLESVGDFSFFGCSALTNITFPKNVNSIGAYSFRACEKLTSVTVLAEDSLPDIGDKAFYLVDEKSSDDDQYYISKDLKFYVPDSALALYNADKIEKERRETKKNNHRYWIDYINAECFPQLS